MSDREFVFQTVAIDHMPGFPPTRAFALDDLSPGINIVYGPNASGKTTLSKALRGLMWGSLDDVDNAILRARLQYEGQQVDARLEGHRVVWKQNGSPVSPPDLAPKTGRDRYDLSLHELLRETDPNRDFAEQILRESAGGFDLEEARKKVRASDAPSRANISETQAVKAAKKHLQVVRRDATEPEAKRKELEDLREERDEARQATKQVEVLGLAIEYLQAEEELEKAKRQVQGYPDALDRVSGDEVERVDEWKKEIESQREILQQAEKTIQDATEELEAADIPDDEPQPRLLSTLRNKASSLRDIEQRQTERKRDLAQAKELRENIEPRLGGEIDPDQVAEIDVDTQHELEDLAAQTQEVVEDEAKLEAVQKWVGEPEIPDNEENVAQGIQLLRRWLTAYEPSPDSTSVRWTTLTASALAIVAGLLVGVAIHPLGYALSVAGLIVALLEWIPRTDRTQTLGDRPTYERDFEKLDLEPPSEWDREAVEARLEDLQEDKASIEVAKERNDLWKKLAPEKEDLEKRRDAVDTRREQILGDLNIEVDLDARGLHWLVTQLNDWQEAQNQITKIEAEMETVEEDRSQLVETINSDLSPFGYNELEDFDEIDGAIDDLDERFQEVRSAKQEIKSAEKEKDRAASQIEKLEKKVEDLFDSLDLEPGDRTALRQLVERNQDYNQALQDKNTAKAQMDQRAEKLTDHPEFESELLQASKSDLEARKTELQTLADRHESLVKSVAQTEEEIRNAKKEHQIEDALATYENALEELADRREDDLDAVIAWELAEHVREQTRDQDRPEVFHKARDRFSQITRGRYELRFDDADPPAFRAYDTRNEEVRNLDELSDGTRLQLLLAVRLGFVEHQEPGPKLPIFLDETLANTDDVRAGALIEAVKQVAADGRQVFYFTAQRDEVDKWRRHLENGDPDAPACTVVDLGDVRDLGTTLGDVPAFDSSSQVTVPAPGESTHTEYGEQLDPSPWNPREPVGDLHLWYIAEDVDTLVSLLETGVESWGQLESIVAAEGLNEFEIESEAYQRAKGLAEAAEAYRHAWQIGRGKPVTRAALDETSAVTDNFIDEVSALAGEVGGDAEEILAALDRGEVARFREQKKEDLRDYFIREGYLDEDPVLGQDQVWGRTTDAVRDYLDEGILSVEAVERLLDRIEDRGKSQDPAK